MPKLLGFIFLLFAVAGAPEAFADNALGSAKPWAIDYGKSRITFSGQLGDNTVFEGGFGKFEATVDFDPEHPEMGSISATIDTRTATAGDAQRDALLPQAEWFGSDKFPTARFTSKTIEFAGNDADGAKVYKATGPLVIKNIEHTVTMLFTLAQEGNHWHAQGKTHLTRGDFGIGTGQFADEKTVRPRVNVTIDIYAQPQ